MPRMLLNDRNPIQNWFSLLLYNQVESVSEPYPVWRPVDPIRIFLCNLHEDSFIIEKVTPNLN